jgi:hypothetical protein
MKPKNMWLGFATATLLAAVVASGCIDADERDLRSNNGGSGGSGANAAGKSAAGTDSSEGGSGNENGGAAGQNGAQGGAAAGSGEVTAGAGTGPTPGGSGEGGGSGAGGEGGGGSPGMGGERPTVSNRELAQWPMPNPAGTGLPHAAQYETTSPAVTLDRITGLTWEAQPVKQDYSWADASALCDAATTGGHQDWRLPTRIELISLLDVTVSEPTIDSSAFPACESSLYWSSTPSAGFPNRYEAIDFQVGYGYADTAGELHFARCVRGNPLAAAPRYTAHNGYVTDNATGLSWEMPAPAGTADYAATIARCDALTAGGITVWRLPSIKELQTLVDVTKSAPAMDTSFFTDVSADVEMFWSASPAIYAPQQPDLIWLLQDDSGVPPATTPDDHARSRCVF